MALAMWTIYYRRSTGTELWIPRSFARFINERAEKTSDEVEAFSLGMLMSAAEMPFGLILVLVAADSILGLPLIDSDFRCNCLCGLCDFPDATFTISGDKWEDNCRYSKMARKKQEFY